MQRKATHYDDQENEVPAVADILGDGMARPDAAGVISRTWCRAHRVQQHRNQELSGESDELSGIARVNALEYEIVFSDARVILADGTVSQNGEATTMGCGSQAQVFV
jgi:hypothetical protein